MRVRPLVFAVALILAASAAYCDDQSGAASASDGGRAVFTDQAGPSIEGLFPTLRDRLPSGPGAGAATSGFVASWTPAEVEGLARKAVAAMRAMQHTKNPGDLRKIQGDNRAAFRRLREIVALQAGDENAAQARRLGIAPGAYLVSDGFADALQGKIDAIKAEMKGGAAPEKVLVDVMRCQLSLPSDAFGYAEDQMTSEESWNPIRRWTDEAARWAVSAPILSEKYKTAIKAYQTLGSNQEGWFSEAFVLKS